MRLITHAKTSSPRYFHLLRWKAVCVMLPLLVLIGLGIRGQLISKDLVYQNAREQAERVLSEAREQFKVELQKLREQSKPPLTYPPVPVPASPGPAQQQYEEALSSPPEQAPELLDVLAHEYPDSLTTSGLPLLPLIQWTRLRIETSPSASAGHAEKLCRAAVTTHPSILTPQLLDRAKALLAQQNLPVETITGWRKRWNEDEAVRAAVRSIQERPGKSAFWFHQAERTWWVERGHGIIPTCLLPQESLEALAAVIVAKIKALLPAYADAEIDLTGKPFGNEVKKSELIAQVEQDDFSLSVLLINRKSLYADWHQQSKWFACLITVALMIELAAFQAIERALKKEALVGELKSNFVSSVSHELRAPIASMRLMSENLESGAASEPAQCHAYHRLMAEECRRLSALIDNVLDFARIEQNRRVYQLVESDVTALVRDAIQLMQPRAQQRHQQICSELEPLERVCDGLAIRQALINLLDNAIKFSPPKSVITVRLKSASTESWEFSVADQGRGIPIGEHSKICERFYRVGNELCRETQGAGIGLSIVQHIIEGHGGSLALDVEAGATFTVNIPNAAA